MAAPLSPFNNPAQDLTFWAKEFLGRKATTLSSRTANNKEAEESLRLKKLIKSAGTTIDDLGDITLQLSQIGFKSIRVYAFPVLEFVRFCINVRHIQSIKEISAGLVQEDFFGARHYESMNTKKNHYRLIVAFVNYIEKNNSIDDEGAGYQFAMEKMPRGYGASIIPESLFPDEFDKFIKFINTDYQTKNKRFTQRNRIMIKMLCYTGFRESELVNLRKKDINSIDADGFYPIKVTGKGNKERVVFLNSVNMMMSGEISGEDDELGVWMRDVDKVVFNIKEVMLYKIVREALESAGISKSKMGPHLLRHSYATYMLAKNVGLVQIQRLLGHESITTTTIYAKVMIKDIKDAARVF